MFLGTKLPTLMAFFESERAMEIFPHEQNDTSYLFLSGADLIKNPSKK